MTKRHESHRDETITEPDTAAPEPTEPTSKPDEAPAPADTQHQPTICRMPADG